MKKTYTLFAILFVSLTTMAQGSAEIQNSNANLAESYQKVAINLFNEVIKNEKDNVCFSPLSAQLALSMLQNGAKGQTLNLMQKTLGTEGLSQEDVNKYNQLVIKTLTDRPDFNHDDKELLAIFDTMYPTCEIANALWNRPDVEICQPFADCLSTYYDADIAPVRFYLQEGIDYVNGWVNEKTHGLINSIYKEPQSTDLAIVLVNALYLKAAWAIPFWKELTKKEQFYLEDGKTVQTDMMFVSDPGFTTGQTGSFRCVNIPYYNSFYMTVFVPADGYELPDFNYEDWKTAVNLIKFPNDDYKQVGVNLKLPKFNIDGNYNLIPALKSMGMAGIFDSSADFTKMCEDNKSVSAVQQFDIIKVDEDGTEAAAVTIIEATESIPIQPEKNIDFFVDRPFYFTIENTQTNTILFMGKVMNPGGSISGEATGIKESLPDNQTNAPVFDLSGRRLSHIPAHGIYIQNGRKYIRR